MPENNPTNPEDVRPKVSDFLTTDADHPRDSGELAFLLGTDKRGIRAMVLHERLDGTAIIGVQNGYYIAPSVEVFQAYVRRRQKYLKKEERELELAAFAVKHKARKEEEHSEQ